jgi:ABC-2 type transport system permease protein
MHSDLRVILAITAKDITDAIKNKNTLANIVMVFLMMVLYSGLPIWERGNESPSLLVFDAGDSSLMAALENIDTIELHAYPSLAAMKERVARGDVQDLGLVIPADYDSRMESGDSVVLEGYVVRWVSDSAASELRSRIETEIAKAVGQTTRIALDENRVDISPGEYGPTFSAALIFVFTILTIGMGVVPHLMIEEKETRTLDAILVSPAESSHLVIAKALTGLFYCLVSVTVAFCFNAAFVVHWGLAVLVAVTGALFSAALGLLFGTLFEVKQQMTIWVFVTLSALLVPTFMSSMSDVLPDWVISLVHWVPPATMAYLFQLSCAANAPLGSYGPELGVVIVSAVLGLAVVIWLVRRSDR